MAVYFLNNYAVMLNIRSRLAESREALVAKSEIHKDGLPGRLTLPKNPGQNLYLSFLRVLCVLPAVAG